MHNFKCGWIKDPHDPNDKKASAHLTLPDDLPETLDIEHLLPPVFNQGEIGSCVWNADVAVLMAAMKKQGVEPKTLSRLFGYWVTRRFEGNNKDEGCVIRNSFKVAKHIGTCEESFWPYAPAKVFECPPFGAFMDARKHQALRYFRVDWSRVEEVQGVLALNFPIVFGTRLYSSFNDVGANGIVSVPDEKSERVIGGHAMVLCGYKRIDGQLYFKVRNSWGSEWGDNGCCWIPESVVTSPSLSDDYWAVELVEV